MDAQKILLVLSAGPNIGQNLAERFKAAGYNLVLVSRSVAAHGITSDGTMTLRADLKDSSSVTTIFETVKAKLGGPPTVVVYNAAGLTVPKDLDNIFTVPLESLQDDMAIMNTSAYVAAGQAVAGFKASRNDVPKAFIYTGNILAAVAPPVPRLVTLESGKSAASYWIGAASALFKSDGFKFYFADERTAEGKPLSLSDLSRPGAAEFYLQLVEGENEIPWHATFVSGKGYVHFPDSTRK